MPKKIIVFSFLLLLFKSSWTQQPNYTFKHLVRKIDTTEFKVVQPKGKDGPIRTYIESSAEVWDLDDDKTTYMKGGEPVLICIEGQQKDGQRDGVFTFYIIDSADHSKRYKIWEQEFSKDKLNGQWRTYTLKGKLAKFETYKDDSLNGLARIYWIDGKKIWDEKEYLNGSNKYIQRLYYDNGKVKEEVPFEGGIIKGHAKRYYETGVLQEETDFKDGKFDGLRKYYYPNGQVWIEETFKDGKHWTVIANYTDKGQKRDAGTLKNGNGTLILYNEDGKVREIINHKNGEVIQ